MHAGRGGRYGKATAGARADPEVARRGAQKRFARVIHTDLPPDHGHGCSQERRRKLLENLTLQANGDWKGLQRAIFESCGKTWPRELLLLLLRQFVSMWM